MTVTAGTEFREGTYGTKVVAVEPGGAGFIPLDERHGRPLNLLWTWMSPNLEFATVFVGVISVLYFEQTFWQAGPRSASAAMRCPPGSTPWSPGSAGSPSTASAAASRWPP